MSVPVWVLLGFAGWTIATLLGSVGVYRWGKILTGKVQIREWQADVPQGSEWYRRAMRAHANCIENLPIYGAVVVAIVATGGQGVALDRLAIVILAARVCQTVTHIAFTPTNFWAWMRFLFFLTQLVCMVWMGLWVIMNSGG